MAGDCACLFVYGTLKSTCAAFGQIPETPSCILPATTRGLLYALERYPVALPGEGLIHGELLVFDDKVTFNDVVLPALDDYEEFLGPGNPANLYTRQLVPVSSGDPAFAQAWIYMYARPLPASARALPGGLWPA